jgi:hypothetical protein
MSGENSFKQFWKPREKVEILLDTCIHIIADWADTDMIYP